MHIKFKLSSEDLRIQRDPDPAHQVAKLVNTILGQIILISGSRSLKSCPKPSLLHKGSYELWGVQYTISIFIQSILVQIGEAASSPDTSLNYFSG